MSVPTLPITEDVLLLPDTSPKPPNPADEVMRAQRGFRHRLVPFQKGTGEPIVNAPKRPAQEIKILRKINNRIKRIHLPILLQSRESPIPNP